MAFKTGEARLQQYLDYIDNTGGEPHVVWFDEDWDPIGPLVRKDLVLAGLVTVDRGFIRRVEDD
jgi:hypothetical protein